jgi:hypothetical protein
MVAARSSNSWLRFVNGDFIGPWSAAGISDSGRSQVNR